MPPPLLHATPPVVLNLRALSHTYALSSLGNLIGSAEPDILRQIWDTISHLMGEIDHLPSSGPATDVQLARSLLLLELRLHDAEAPAEGVDPFHLASTNADLPREHRPLLEQLLRSERRKVGVLTAAKTVVVEAPWSAVTSMIKWFLENTAFATLGRECVPPIIDVSRNGWIRADDRSVSQQRSRPRTKSDHFLRSCPLPTLNRYTNPSSRFPPPRNLRAFHTTFAQ
jgi:hypothetical protein